MTPDTWRRYYTGEPALLRSRRQSAAFCAAYGFVPLPLQAHSKAAIVGPPPPFPEWLDLDHPDSRNWSVAIPRAAPTHIWADIDCDTRTLSSATDWTEELLAEAKHYQRIVSDAFDFFGVSCHRFGRDCLNNLGHALLPISLDAPGLRQPPLDLLDMLGMKRKVRVNNLLVGIEVRRASEKRLSIPKSITLPGSTYPGYDKPLDLIRWREEADFPEGRLWERTLGPQPLHALRMALYAALLTLGTINLWAQGDRHNMALIVSGALAHESGAGFLGNDNAAPDDAQRVFEFLLGQTGDPEAKDRLKVFKDTMTAFEAGRPVTGYKTLRETVGDDVVKALLSMRGGSDPDALSDMFANAIFIESENKWLWLPNGSRLMKLRSNAEMQQAFRHHPGYPPLPGHGRTRPTHLIDIVMNHDRKRRISEMVSFPGVPFGVCYAHDNGSYTAIDDEDQVARIERGEPIRQLDAINVSTGFATPPIAEGQVPDPQAWSRALFLWKRHRARLTQDIDLQNRKLDQIIARKIQHPRVKYPLGCALVGGQAIGKSALFFVILDRIVGGELIGYSSRAEMETDFRYRKLDRSIFYVVEELRLSTLPPTLQESFKELMRNEHIERNRKYGSQDTCRNVAVPFITSNEKNPTLLVDGIPDRALVVIHGQSQESLGLTALEWSQEKAKIREEVIEFKTALQDPGIRQALFHFWDHLEIDDAIFDDTETANVSADDIIHALAPIEQVLLDMLIENGAIFPGYVHGPTLFEPFLYETVIEGIVARTGKTRITKRELGQAWAGLFLDSQFKRSEKPNHMLNRNDREKMVRAKQWTTKDRQRVRSYYLAKRPHELAEWFKEYRNLEIEFELDIYPVQVWVEPDQEALQRAYDKRENYPRFSRSLGSP